MKHYKLITLLFATLGCSAAFAQSSPAEGVCSDSVNVSPCCSEAISTVAPRCFSLKEGWFLEAGLDMNMYNPYGLPFSEVFPKGRSHGIDVAFGKYFTPGIGVRARLNWENGLPLFENKRLEWLSPVGPNGLNMDAGGCVWAYLDVLMSIPALCSYPAHNRRWDVLLIPRAGIGTNCYLGSLSPIVGMGTGFTYRLSRRIKLYADLSYQGITSEFFGDSAGNEHVSGTGMEVPTGFNGILTLQAGVQVNIGRLKH